MFCREWLAQLESHKHEIAQAGLRMAAVGLAAPRHARRYCGRLAPSALCLANESHELYHAYGLGQGSLLQLVGPQVFAAGVRTQARGHGFSSDVIGDYKMLPGSFIIDRAGVVRYAHYSRHAGEHADLAEVLAVARNLWPAPALEPALHGRI